MKAQYTRNISHLSWKERREIIKAEEERKKIRERAVSAKYDITTSVCYLSGASFYLFHYRKFNHIMILPQCLHYLVALVIPIIMVMFHNTSIFLGFQDIYLAKQLDKAGLFPVEPIDYEDYIPKENVDREI